MARRVYWVEVLTRHNVSCRSGPFASRIEAERMAVELVRRADVQPEARIVALEAEADEIADEDRGQSAP